MNESLKKLKDDFIVLVVGVLVGLPAWGIILPQVFSVISGNSVFDPSSLFKAFTIIYFTIPFFTVFLLIIFQLKDAIFRRMRFRMILFMGSIVILMLIVPLLHSRTLLYRWFEDFLSYVILFVSILQLYLYLRYFYDKKWIRRGLLNNRGTIQQQAENIEQKDPKLLYLIFINFGIFLLFIPIQWTIAFLATANHLLYNSYLFLMLCIIAYFVPFYIYKRFIRTEEKNISLYSPEIRRYIRSTKDFLSKALLVFPVILIIIIFFSGGLKKGQKFDLKALDNNYFERFTSSRQLVDTTLREMELIETMRQYDSMRIKMDASNSEVNADTNVVNPVWVSQIIRDTSHLIDQYEKLQLKALPAFRNLSPQQRENILIRYKAALKALASYQISRASEDLLGIAQETQRTGIIVFTSTLMILLFVLCLLFFMDESCKFSYSPEIDRIRKILSTAAILIMILLFPLVKNISKEDIKSYQPWALFKLHNWNLRSDYDRTESGNKFFRDTLVANINTSECCCCNTGNIFLLDSNAIWGTTLINRLDNISRSLETISNSTAKSTVAPSKDSLVEELKTINIALQTLLTAMQNYPKPPFDVNVKNWPDSLNLIPLQQKVDAVINVLSTNFKQLPQKGDVRDVVTELTKLAENLKNLNSKGTLFNSKTGNNTNEKD